MNDHVSLQRTSGCEPVSSEAATLAREILDGDLSIDHAIARAAELLLSSDRVEVVATALTSFAPEDEAGWTRLGGRAWVREWANPGASASILPPTGAGPEHALTMPWISRIARSGLAILVDRELLPEEADQDREELNRVGVRSLVGSVYGARGAMFGSLSAGSERAGQWPEELIGSFRLLNAAITSRLTQEHSRRALAEAIETSNEAQLSYQHFFGAVGHELRTPLAAIMGYTEVLMDDASSNPQDPVSAGLLQDGPVILRACEQLVSVVDSLLGAGRTFTDDDQRQDVVVADAVADVVHWHRAPSRSAGVTMEVDIDPSVTAWAHPSAVRQVLTNLVGNAIAYHRPEGGSVHLSAVSLRGESGQEMVRIIVRDDGLGLTSEQMQRVFEPFVRFADKASKGSGLGLSISRTIAERDGGAVQGTSTPGVGSSFWLELPAKAPYVP
ncbi:signal transduction histidine kinase [Nocardioides sp. BE266]|uniref:sensor histidine kinase n=1 Tax=Nocardioides sp. BE266 TaxID=2817725 RepID=UPI002862C607|nr:HAMP domain-containing sensor histidine kinase [Nocardioides sp. BE266]MDR7252031.1 signal transduction histidine kinase [Nocardioides sp. BE266]